MAETRIRLVKAELELKAVIEEGRIRLLTAVAAQQKLLMDSSLRMSDRDRLFLRDKANDILYTDLVGGRPAGEGQQQQAEAPPRKTLEITAVAREMGYHLDVKEAGLIGRKMAQKFRAAFPGKEIPKTERFVDGAVRAVNWYEDVPAQRAMMEEAVREFVEEAHKRPAQSRRLE
eukprot:jgi/Mesvir1/10187/Mv05729-RA.1